MSITTAGAVLILLAAFAYVARAVLSYTPVRPSPNAALAMGLCAAIGLALVIFSGVMA